ncbi:MAG: hypothetical protein U0736_04015 [Gemmataceae bacterium]
MLIGIDDYSQRAWRRQADPDLTGCNRDAAIAGDAAAVQKGGTPTCLLDQRRRGKRFSPSCAAAREVAANDLFASALLRVVSGRDLAESTFLAR